MTGWTKTRRLPGRGVVFGGLAVAMLLLVSLLSPSADLDAGTLVLHTALDKAVPAVDATVEGAVQELHLIYTTAVQIRLSAITVQGADGEVEAGDLAFLADSEERGLRLPLGSPLTGGTYTVSWRTAGPDSHPIRGEYSFTVAAER